ncbi:MAG TPA: acyl-CoA dehydrogenase family protein [Aldersonia sp.]
MTATPSPATTHPHNQVVDFEGVNAFTGDPIATSVLGTHAPWAREYAEKLGALVWDHDTLIAARDAHRFLPELRTLNRVGDRIDHVEFHPAYHALMRMAFGNGVAALSWNAPAPGGHLARAVQSYLWNQVDGATACPTGMTYAAAPLLSEIPELAPYAERVKVHDYDPSYAPIETKRAATIGYAMTEKQGGSDLRANSTVAAPIGKRGQGEAYLLNGHKWFCSVPMSDGFFTVAQTEAGTSCLFAPRWRPDGTPNGIAIQRLKDKCGNKANASSEIEYHNAYAILLGDEGRGIRTILTSSDYTRLDFAAGSAGLIRAALSQAINHADQRMAFGSRLSDIPTMTAVLADLTLEWAAATHLAFRLANTIDHDDVSEKLLQRLLTPVGKYWNCKRAPVIVAEAMECLGGNGYIEEHPMARYYREAPLNGIWEGTSNMMVLDVERVLTREPKALEPVLDEIRLAEGANSHLDRATADLEDRAATPGKDGRRLASQIALTLQASLLVRHAPAAVSDAFCASRLGGQWGPVLGSLSCELDLAAVVAYGRLG